MPQWGDLVGKDYVQRSPTKEVLILGAGASADEGIGVQQKLLPEIAALSRLPPREPDWVDPVRLMSAWKTVEEYLEKLFPGALLEEIRLEDCLTLFDIAVERGEVVAGKGPRELDRIGQAFAYCLLSYIRLKTEVTAAKHTPMTQLGQYLSATSMQTRDSHSIISFNWDISIDRGLTSVQPGRWPAVDYCTYTVPWETSPNGPLSDIPSLWKRPLNIPAIKLLKPHGSVNWLWCPTCDRLVVGGGTVIGWHGPARGGREECGERPKQGRYCPRCSDNHAQRDAPLLREVLVTPTMVKNLNMTHLRMIWHNAFRELSEASSVVIIGYTLPEADFEFRYLFLKALAANPNRPKVRIISRRNESMDQVEKSRQEQQEKWYRSVIGKNRLADPEKPVERVGVDAFVKGYIST